MPPEGGSTRGLHYWVGIPIEDTRCEGRHSTFQLMEGGKEDALPNERLLPRPLSLSISSFDMLFILTISSSFTISVKQCTELALSELLEHRSKNRS
jgi:hypothetical protein